MKKADNRVIIVYGDNANINIGENKAHLSVAIAILLNIFATAAVLAVSYYCPDLLADCVRFIISTVISC